MEWPIKKSGTGEGIWEDRIEVRSERTRDVGPLRPRWDIWVTERPHPLRWSEYVSWMSRMLGVVGEGEQTVDRSRAPRCPKMRGWETGCNMHYLRSYSVC